MYRGDRTDALLRDLRVSGRHPAPKNVPDYVNQKLLDLARQRNADFGCSDVAEKLEAMLKARITNGRMKNFYGLERMAHHLMFNEKSCPGRYKMSVSY
jgi:hypothetical protein